MLLPACQARLAANRAYLRGLGLTPSAIKAGLISALDPDHSAVAEAARRLAQQEAVARAEKQVRRSVLCTHATQTHAAHCRPLHARAQLQQKQRELDARRRARRTQEARWV